jgi:mono/diheme cytochrome c family protein
MRASTKIVPILLLLLFAASSMSHAQDKEVVEGQHLYLRYCASCHGMDGLGGGPVAKSLKNPPANLRLLADKYGSPLPAAALAELIDGRKAVRAHGTSDMPVWDARLYGTSAGDKGEPGISDAIRKIVAYLNSIQVHRTASR